MTWDPEQYLAYADERALPFRHLLAEVAHLKPARVLDAGCGPGALTATLLETWPEARIQGVDSSAEMIGLARRRAVTRRLTFELADLSSWSPAEPFDLILSNACFHWIEDHHRLIGHLESLMKSTATLAFQVPANHDQPSLMILDELWAEDPWRPFLDGPRPINVRSPDWYADQLDDRGFRVTAWQTTYFHRLEGKDPVLEWVKGTTLRPVLDRLDEARADALLEEYGARLRRTYPKRGGVTVFPFTRTFVVATR